MGILVGLVIKVKKNQRVYFAGMILEVSYEKGQFKIFINGPRPFPFKFEREELEDYRKRTEKNSYKGGHNESGFCNLHAVCISTGAG